jgi:hypothetical protein
MPALTKRKWHKSFKYRANLNLFARVNIIRANKAIANSLITITMMTSEACSFALSIASRLSTKLT